MLLDIREPVELTICQLAGAQLIPLSQMNGRLGEIPRDRPVVVFCHHGIRSARVVTQLRAMGFDNVVNMIGGIEEWSLTIDPSIPRY